MSLATYQLRPRSGNYCVVVGLGLVGGAIARKLSDFAELIARPVASLDWRQSEAIVAAIMATLEYQSVSRLDLVWAAGRGGFAATKEEMDTEFNVYAEVLEQLDRKFGDALTVNLLSSAGGVYEAAGRIEHIDEIAPTRPYAISKLEQEALLAELGISHRIYRPSSVYGLGGRRMGLIQTLVKNTVTGQSLNIYADQNTLRDYVLSADVGRQIVSDILTQEPGLTRIIATGRSTSIAMLLNLIQRITGHSPAASFQTDPSNSEDIVFAPKLFANNLPTTTLEEGIRLVYKLTMSGSQAAAR
jgi:UDP-glucose 4-epimerase